jgi:hypothetical protein
LLDAEKHDQDDPLQFSKGITAADLKSLEKRLSAAAVEIRRVLEPDAKP